MNRKETAAGRPAVKGLTGLGKAIPGEEQGAELFKFSRRRPGWVAKEASWREPDGAEDRAELSAAGVRAQGRNCDALKTPALTPLAQLTLQCGRCPSGSGLEF